MMTDHEIDSKLFLVREQRKAEMNSFRESLNLHVSVNPVVFEVSQRIRRYVNYPNCGQRSSAVY